LSNDFPEYGQFGCGLYKVFSDVDPSYYFYLDYRDDNYGSYTNSIGHNADIWLEYNGSNDAIYISNDPSSLGFPDNPISKGKILRIWELKGQGTPSTDEFPNFWQNSIVIITEGNNNHPNLVWGPHPTFNTTNYYVYRAVHSQPTIPRFRNYELIGITSDTVFSFIDYEAQLNQGSWYFYYYVKAYNSNTSSFSLPTNTVETSGNFTPYKNNSNSLNDPNYSFHLYQNYPNPFNPTTEISYSIPKSSFVTLKVYDTLGKEVATLVNERKEQGRYTVEFIAANLPSGMYIYQITVGKYRASGKMLLMK